MSLVEIPLSWLDPVASADLSLPAYATEGAAGMDVMAALNEPLLLQPGAISLIPCGFAIALPEGYEAQLRPRSGLALRAGITLINAPGTIDCDYRGEIKVALINLGQEAYRILRGDRVAQLVIAPVAKATFQVVAQLGPSSRGAGGFGHSGLRWE